VVRHSRSVRYTRPIPNHLTSETPDLACRVAPTAEMGWWQALAGAASPAPVGVSRRLQARGTVLWRSRGGGAGPAPRDALLNDANRAAVFAGRRSRRSGSLDVAAMSLSAILRQSAIALPRLRAELEMRRHAPDGEEHAADRSRSASRSAPSRPPGARPAGAQAFATCTSTACGASSDHGCSSRAPRSTTFATSSGTRTSRRPAATCAARRCVWSARWR